MSQTRPTGRLSLEPHTLPRGSTPPQPLHRPFLRRFLRRDLPILDFAAFFSVETILDLATFFSVETFSSSMLRRYADTHCWDERYATSLCRHTLLRSAPPIRLFSSRMTISTTFPSGSQPGSAGVCIASWIGPCQDCPPLTCSPTWSVQHVSQTRPTGRLSRQHFCATKTSDPSHVILGHPFSRHTSPSRS